MKKSTYLAKLAATEITDSNTVGQWKEAEKLKKKLTRFWEKEALRVIKETTGRDLAAEIPGWTSLEFEFNLKANGTVIVKQFVNDQFRSPQLREKFAVRKSNILSS